MRGWQIIEIRMLPENIGDLSNFISVTRSTMPHDRQASVKVIPWWGNQVKAPEAQKKT